MCTPEEKLHQVYFVEMGEEKIVISIANFLQILQSLQNTKDEQEYLTGGVVIHFNKKIEANYPKIYPLGHSLFHILQLKRNGATFSPKKPLEHEYLNIYLDITIFLTSILHSEKRRKNRFFCVNGFSNKISVKKLHY